MIFRSSQHWKVFGFAALWGATALAASAPTMAGEIGTLERLPDDTGIAVIDVRNETECRRGSLPASRCLPASVLFGDDGNSVSFHAVRWLLGTIGLTGRESVAVYSDNAGDARAVAGLLYLSGQTHVAVLAPTLADDLTLPGSSRSLSREVVFTAPMRDPAMRPGVSVQPFREQAIALAMGDASIPLNVNIP